MSRQDLPSAQDRASVDAPSQDGPARSGGHRRALLAGIAALVLAGAGYGGWYYWTEGRFFEDTDDAYVQADIARISSRVQGYVASLPVEENAHVRAGEVLVRLEDGDYRTALATAQSRVATADRRLARIDAQIDAARAAVRQAEADRDAAQAQLRNAGNTLERVTGLAERNFAAQAQLDSATEGYDTAQASLAKAVAAVASAHAEVAVLVAQRAEAEGDKHELELAVDQAERDLKRTVLRAPADGILANLGLEIGDLVTAGTQLAALVPDDALYVEANFKETQMQGITPGARVEVTLDALPGRSFEGRVTSAAPATGSVFSVLPADNATGNFTKVVQRVPVRIALPPEAAATGQLRAGLSAVVAVDTRSGGAPAARLAAAR
ncbi:HlyD family secretion protein [Rhodovulum sulfidophilum]|uniref:HlyD family secretion protein n=1 Tax=Rhodovulum sulfidophilum TaxID=35806 RepID=UPI000953103F|nr:HlyD family secretion protein [Rhodovulum sulfidophilum]OLS52458.1 hemolysin D [Rhodovulum sulfidophilum]